MAPNAGTTSPSHGTRVPAAGWVKAGSRRVCTVPGKPWDYLLTCANAIKEESSLDTVGRKEGGAGSMGEEESGLGRCQQRHAHKIPKI